MKIRILATLSAALLPACSGPTVKLSTPEPVKVDIAMRLDVYQHDKEDKPAPPSNMAAPGKERLNRAADIQTFKNARLVGESADALLVIRVEPPGDYGDYIRQVVAMENADRLTLMKDQADREKIPLPSVQKKQADLARKMAFKGEWIEIEKTDGSREWIQKEG